MATDPAGIVELEPTPDGWRATVAQGGHIVPNTTWSYRFRVVTDEGHITLRAFVDRSGREDDGWICIEVEDTGIGIAEEDLELVASNLSDAIASWTSARRAARILSRIAR